jgi:hypothetical protein
MFRLRGVLMGTIAYQTYAAMLGVRLRGALTQTSDVDEAQFLSLSSAVQDQHRSFPPPIDAAKICAIRESDFRLLDNLALNRRRHFPGQLRATLRGISEAT